MKKCLIMLVIGATAMVSNAAYLYWQVSSSDYAGGVDAGDTVYSASIFYTTAGTATAGTLVQNNYFVQGESATSLGSKVSAPSTDMFVADMGSFNTELYSYYVELYNSSGSVISRSAVTNYNDVPQRAWADTGSSTGSMIDIPTAANITAWHAGGYRAVPEPTSAMLMLFGAAFLGLKRKNRSIA